MSRRNLPQKADGKKKTIAAPAYGDSTQVKVERMWFSGATETDVARKLSIPPFEARARIRQVETQLEEMMAQKDSQDRMRLMLFKVFRRSERRQRDVGRVLRHMLKKANFVRAMEWVKLGQAEDKLQLEMINKFMSGGGDEDEKKRPSPETPLGASLRGLVQGAAQLPEGSRVAMGVEVGQPTKSSQDRYQTTKDSVQQAIYDGAGGASDLRDLILRGEKKTQLSP